MLLLRSRELSVPTWRLEVGGWRLEVGGWRLKVGGWMMDVGGWRFKVKKLFILNPTSSPMRQEVEIASN